MKKRGQIAIFVVIALVIIAAVIAYLLLSNKASLTKTPSIKEAESIRSYVQKCVDINLQDAVNLVGLQGGYVLLPQNHFTSNLSEIAYGYYEKQRMLPTRTKVEMEISTYVRAFTYLCLNQSSFPVDIRAYNFEGKTTLSDDKVSISINFPITVSNNETSAKIDEQYSSKIDSRLGEMYNLANEIVNKEINNSDEIDITYLISQRYPIVALTYDKTIVYAITYLNDTSEESYIFRFANKFT